MMSDENRWKERISRTAQHYQRRQSEHGQPPIDQFVNYYSPVKHTRGANVRPVVNPYMPLNQKLSHNACHCQLLFAADRQTDRQTDTARGRSIRQWFRHVLHFTYHAQAGCWVVTDKRIQTPRVPPSTSTLWLTQWVYLWWLWQICTGFNGFISSWHSAINCGRSSPQNRRRYASKSKPCSSGVTRDSGAPRQIYKWGPRLFVTFPLPALLVLLVPCPSLPFPACVPSPVTPNGLWGYNLGHFEFIHAHIVC